MERRLPDPYFLLNTFKCVYKNHHQTLLALDIGNLSYGIDEISYSVQEGDYIEFLDYLSKFPKLEGFFLLLRGAILSETYFSSH